MQPRVEHDEFATVKQLLQANLDGRELYSVIRLL